MTVSFYNQIEARLQEKLTWFSWFKLFNNQFESMENQQEQTFPNLSIFMEFLSPVQVIGMGAGLQMYDCVVRFHLYLITYDLQDLQILTYKSELYKALERYVPENASVLDRISEEPDQNHNGYMVWKMDFTCQIADEDASMYSNVADAAPVQLDLTGDLIIDNEVIRTGVLPS
jgi:hypothetical protein